MLVNIGLYEKVSHERQNRIQATWINRIKYPLSNNKEQFYDNAFVHHNNKIILWLCADWTMLVSLCNIDIYFLSKILSLNERKRVRVDTMQVPPYSFFVIDGVLSSLRRGV